VLDALGISSSSLHPSCPMQVMVKGGSRLLIGLQSATCLESLRPQMDQLVHLTPHVGADGFFVFAMQPNHDGMAATESRNVLPGYRRARGPRERQRARNARCVPRAQWSARLRCRSVSRFVGHQGRFVDRPGRVDVEVTARAVVRRPSASPAMP
jgi:predicted PhzF superfamily epimerase YddE/YHI9